MRRPSWNKSQAIQQVISLKSLLEPSPPANSNSNAAALKSALVRPPNVPSYNTVSIFYHLFFSYVFLLFLVYLV